MRMLSRIAPVAAAAILLPLSAVGATAPAAAQASAAPAAVAKLTTSTTTAASTKPALGIQTVSGRTELGDAYAAPGANACSWDIGTSAIENRLTFDNADGTYTLSSFENLLTSPPTQYVDGGNASPEFRFTWNGQVLTGDTAGWSCSSGAVSQVSMGGQPALQLDVTVERPGVRVTKHYVIYPGVSLIRQWTQYTNTSSTAQELATPSFLADNLMGSQIQAGNVHLDYMTGAVAVPGSWTLQTGAETSAYSRTFDSYDAFGCTNAEAAQSGGCPQTGWSETSSAYIPWFSMWNTASNNGVYMGFDYNGRWAAPIGAQNGEAGSLALDIPNYDSAIQPGASVTSPKSFTGTYVSNLDDMTNRLLAWQYQYMWDYTRPAYFANIRMLGTWSNGAVCFAAGTPDYSGTLQKVFGLVDHMAYIGASTYHRDCGWWDTAGNWQGPDWKISKNYLSEYGMQQLIYYWAYDANTNSAIYQEHPDWFTSASPCGYADRLIDLSNPAAEQYVTNLLISDAKKWGDYQWRNDSCPVGATDGAQQLAQSQAYQRVQQAFLDALPGSAIQHVDSGGNEVNYEGMRMASSFSISDLSGVPEQHDASLLFPTDKMSGIPDDWNPANCANSWNILLQFNPDFTGDTNDPRALECMRKLVADYRYLLQEGVAGRWVWQYHPTGTDSSSSDSNWFERVSRDHQRALVIYQGSGSSNPVTMYPRGLNPDETYTVGFQFHSGTYDATGAQLMADGITLASIQAGELVWLNMPGHPGSGTDQTAPTPPGNVQVALNTNMGYTGVGVTWSAGTDNNFVDYYNILRDGKVIGKVSQGDYFFDHMPGATPSATYAVQTVDGDGNVSAPVQAKAPAAVLSATTADDSPGNGVTYTGAWQHQSGMTNVYDGTLSTTRAGCNTACQGFSGVQGANNFSYQDEFNGVWQNMQDFSPAGAPASYLGMAQWTDNSPQGGFVWPSAEHPPPVNTDAAARVWTAPQAGKIYIQSRAMKLVSGGSVNVQITQNGQVVAGPETIQGTDTTTGAELDVNALPVAAGDVIRFEIRSIGSYAYDATTWDPEISYQPITPPAAPTATYTFTGSQITWYAALGPNEGQARVSIDGVPQSTINLYAPDPNSDSVPVYTRTFDIVGTHTITVTALGNNLTPGNAISVDGFQASTSTPSVVQDSDPAVNYQGSGWAQQAAAQASGGSIMASSQAGDSVSYTFTGDQITLVGRLCPACGEADVYIDGQYATRIDGYGYRGPAVWQAALFEDSWQHQGPHTIKVVVDGTKNISSTSDEVDIDAFQVRRP